MSAISPPLISVDRSIKFKPSRAVCRKTTPNPQPYMVREGMRGDDQQQNHIFSYLSPEEQWAQPTFRWWAAIRARARTDCCDSLS
jgi:hypothetical protein